MRFTLKLKGIHCTWPDDTLCHDKYQWCWTAMLSFHLVLRTNQESVNIYTMPLAIVVMYSIHHRMWGNQPGRRSIYLWQRSHLAVMQLAMGHFNKLDNSHFFTPPAVIPLITGGERWHLITWKTDLSVAMFPQKLWAFSSLGMCSFISPPQGYMGQGYLLWCKKDVSTNLVLFRLPSSGTVLVEVLFFDSQAFTPSTRSSTSESVSVSSLLWKHKTSSENIHHKSFLQLQAFETSFNQVRQILLYLMENLFFDNVPQSFLSFFAGIDNIMSGKTIEIFKITGITLAK